jgi:hypothetical protein
MLLRNNTTEIRAFGYQVKPGAPAKDGNPSVPPTLAKIVLVPGNNEVDPAAYTELMKNELFRLMFEVVGVNGRPILEADKEVSLKDITKIETKKAVKIVSETWDRGLLRGWQRPETRREVGDAIDAQLAKIARGSVAATAEEAATG